MKILHTSDWHIGRFLNQRSLLPDQEYVMKSFMDLVQREKPDVLLIAGDLYDRSIPSKEALALVDEVLNQIILDMNIPTIIIGGNHDSGDRLSFNSGILEKRGLYIRGVMTESPEPIILNDEYGPVAFWPVPFTKPVEYRNLTGNTEIHDFQDMYASIVDEIKGRMDKNIRNVMITHGMILSHAPTDEDIDDSVRPIEIGGISYAEGSLFDDFDYVALGHLHRPQQVGRPEVRYAGSLLKYSFSEVKQKKSITLVEMDDQGHAEIRTEALDTKRDMRMLTGELSDLTGSEALEDPNRDDYIKAVLTDDVRRLNPMEQLKKVYPNILEMEYQSLNAVQRNISTRKIKERLSDPLSLFGDFYEYIHGVEMTEEKKEIVKTIMEEAHETH